MGLKEYKKPKTELSYRELKKKAKSMAGDLDDNIRELTKHRIDYRVEEIISILKSRGLHCEAQESVNEDLPFIRINSNQNLHISKQFRALILSSGDMVNNIEIINIPLNKAIDIIIANIDDLPILKWNNKANPFIETEKAIGIKVKYIVEDCLWFPKSVILDKTELDKGLLKLPKWVIDSQMKKSIVNGKGKPIKITK